MRIVFGAAALAAVLWLVGQAPAGEDAAGKGGYDFRATEAYRALTAADRDALEQVQRDFNLLWGALDRYADEHGGAPPDRLADLAPRYLLRLPVDPFAAGGERSYGYRRGAAGNRAWVLSSQGLSSFPYLAARGNVGLYVCKGIWISGINPTRVPSPEDAVDEQPEAPPPSDR